jgi:S-adenosyl methyltransferase
VNANAPKHWPGLDPTTPNVARMYDYYLGGKDNFEADRAAAEKVLAVVPGLRQGVHYDRCKSGCAHGAPLGNPEREATERYPVPDPPGRLRGGYIA